MLSAKAHSLDVDIDVVYAGVMLHDLGLTPAYHATDVRFEVASANAARALVRKYNMSNERADKVWDVAALHATRGIAEFKSPETAVASSGIAGDVTGFGLDQFDPTLIQRLMVTRAGFAHPFIDAIVTDLQDKPQVASGTWMESIAEDHIAGFRPSTAAAIGGLTLEDARRTRCEVGAAACRSCVCEDNRIEGGCWGQDSGWACGPGTG